MSETLHTANGYHVDFYASCRIITDKKLDTNRTELYNITCINCMSQKSELTEKQSDVVLKRSYDKKNNDKENNEETSKEIT